MNAGIKTRAFPGAAVAITHLGRLVALKGLGAFTYDANAPRVQPDTIYDLASVSKVVATTAMAMLLHERGFFELDQSVAWILAEFPAGKQVTFRHLLAHASGLPAYARLYESARTRDDLLRAACATPLAHAPGSRAEYSDIGFIILGKALSRLAEEPLDRFCQHQIFGPLGMSRT
ncbi:MAG TPA: serine hydrolase domain-containing protein, partial [Terriglobales bacterium]|nr:serine hydrolase domain-containing protein [Terriglobales bacterium]